MKARATSASQAVIEKILAQFQKLLFKFNAHRLRCGNLEQSGVDSLNVSSREAAAGVCSSENVMARRISEQAVRHHLKPTLSARTIDLLALMRQTISSLGSHKVHTLQPDRRAVLKLVEF